MKIILSIFLLALSISASEVQTDASTKPIVPKYVVDAANFGLIESKNAFFIIGGRKHGIMKDSFAFTNKEDAEAYVEKNGGTVVDYKTFVEGNTTK